PRSPPVSSWWSAKASPVCSSTNTSDAHGSALLRTQRTLVRSRMPQRCGRRHPVGFVLFCTDKPSHAPFAWLRWHTDAWLKGLLLPIAPIPLSERYDCDVSAPDTLLCPHLAPIGSGQGRAPRAQTSFHHTRWSELPPPSLRRPSTKAPLALLGRRLLR